MNVRPLAIPLAEHAEHRSFHPRPRGRASILAGRSGVIRGAAQAARLLGPRTSANHAQSPTINVSSTAVAVATATAENSVILSLDLIADWPGITPEAADEVRGVKAALDAKDKPTMMAKAARAATLLAPFPNLATAIMDAVSHAAQLFQRTCSWRRR